jgi:predicted metal-dependent phosphotriesterase family hydrolase
MTVVAADAYLATVHGEPLRPGDGVWLDAHAHAWIDPPEGVRDPHRVALRDEPRRRAALADYARVALPRRAALVDCQPPGAGRDARVLARLSAASGVAIVATTGFHLARYYPHDRRPWANAGAAHRAFTAELAEGMAELPGRRVGVIKAADTGAAEGGRDGADAPWWEAALAARADTDALLLIHTERGAGAAELVDWLVDRGAPAERLFLCHVDKRADPVLHAELASTGALLGYDTFLRPAYDPERTTWPLVRRMLDAGLAHALAFGLDLAAPAMWPSALPAADPPDALGPTGLVTAVAARLQALGATSADVDALLGGNLVRRAARVPTPPARADEQSPGRAPASDLAAPRPTEEPR